MKNKNAIIFRIGTLYGIGDSIERVRFNLILNHLVKAADRIILASVKTKHTGIYNLDSQNTCISELAGEIKQYMPNVLVNKVDGEFEDARNYRVSSQKALNKLGFRSRFSVKEVIGEMRVS